ncbi:ABC transporter permease [Aquimarina atlantica]|uniref:ABC transporter permease n=1 Tax=Aquimarina atlantica TaxID=1317122 RepID=A0A023BR04_9FLAO|nr:ABC transporter permease [Aquimarina atlantica]EZH72495.1 ABC transporter permease [Aquimarina atlantica]
MIKNYIKIAWRNLIKNKFFSLINIFGLAVGLATCFLLMLYVFNETSYDKHHKDVNQIYRVALEAAGEKWAAGPAPLAQGLASDFAEVEQVTRILNFPTTDKMLLKDENANVSFYETNGYYVDSTFFKVFTYDFSYGDLETALNQPNTVVISEAIAHKLYGDANPINKIINIEIPYGKYNYTVKGVFKNNGDKSHINANFFLSMQNGDIGEWVGQQTNWAYNNIFHTYIKLKKGVNTGNFEEKLPAFLKRNAAVDFKEMNLSKQLFLQPVKDIYLKSDIGNELSTNGNMTYLYIFGSIAAFLLLIACINFMNLSTARSEKRAKEVGVRKVMGAHKQSLIFQYLGESLMMSVLALALSMVIVVLFLPIFNEFSQKELMPFENSQLMFWVIGLTLFTGLLSGLYPAFYLSSFKITTVLKGKLANSFSATFIRKGLVVFQFAISVCLILVAVVIVKQLDFIKNQDLGFKKDQQIILPLRSASVVGNYNAFKDEMLKDPKVASVSAASTYPGFDLVQDMFIYAEGKSLDDKIEIHYAQAYEDYIKTLGYELIRGRFLSTNPEADLDGVVLNETAIKQLGYDVDNAIGKKVYHEFDKQPQSLHIVGVIKDFHSRSFHNSILPYAIRKFSNGTQPSYFIVNIKEGQFDNALASVKSVWEKVNPDTPFQYSFLDQDFQRNYEKEQRMSDVIICFTLIAIFIACLGLLGLASFTTEQRKKEVGIRRVLGASVIGITTLLSKDFLKLVVAAIAFASPISYYLGKRWLEGFAYHIDMSWWLFVITGGVALGIAFATVSFQVIKAAVSNPVKSLRTE